MVNAMQAASCKLRNNISVYVLKMECERGNMSNMKSEEEDETRHNQSERKFTFKCSRTSSVSCDIR